MSQMSQMVPEHPLTVLVLNPQMSLITTFPGGSPLEPWKAKPWNLLRSEAAGTL